MIKLGLGLNDIKGAMKYVRFNAQVEVFFSVGINVADYILRDEATLTEFGINSASDIAKGMLSLVGAALVVGTFIPMSFGVLATGIVFAVVSFGIGKGLNFVDKQEGYTERFIDFLEKEIK